MATTTNFGWTTPDDTSLVKDGAAAIRSLGSAIDSTVFTNASAAIAKTIVDAKGDIIAATAADTVARLASSGVNDQVLTIDTSTATGLKWAAVSAGPTVLGSLTLNGAADYTFSSISGIYQTLQLVLTDSRDNNASTIKLTINGSTAGNYFYTRMDSGANTLTRSTNETGFSVCNNGPGANNRTAFSLTFPNYSKSNIIKTFYGTANIYNTPAYWWVGHNNLDAIRDAAITSLTITNGGAVNWVDGTLTLYGVN